MNCYMKRALLAGVSVSVAVLAVSGPVAAQEPSGDLEEIVVYGIRNAIKQAAEVKRESDVFVDSIIAEDISKLADENVAEALSRVTGVQVRRSSTGEGDQVDVRGLTFNRLSLNDRTLPTFLGRGGGSDPNNGELSVLGIIPSEIVSRLDVTKLPSADQVEGSIGGDIDIITHRPLDVDFRITASAQLIHADLADEDGFKGTLLFSEKFADDTLGVSFGYTRAERELREDRFFSLGGWADRSGAFGEVNGLPVFGIAGLRYQQLESDRETETFNGALQWEPNDDLAILVDVIVSETDINEQRNWLQMNLPGSPDGYTDLEISSNGTIVAGTFENRFRGNTNTNPINNFKTESFGIGGEYRGKDRWTMSGDISYAKSDRQVYQNFLLNRTRDPVSASFDFGAGSIPSLEVSPIPGAEVDIRDIEDYQVIIFFNIETLQESEDFAVRFDFEYEIDAGVLQTVEFGGRYQNLEATRAESNTFQLTQLDPAINNGFSFPQLSDPTYAPFGVFAARADLLDDTGVNFPRAGIISVPNAFGIRTCESGIFDNINGGCGGPQLQPLSSFSVDEDSLAAYVKGNFEGSIGSKPFSAHVGVRITQTDLTVNGSQQVTNDIGDTVLEPGIADNDYTDVLPSATIKVDLTDELLLRVGYAKTMARPSVGNLNTGFSVILADPNNSVPTLINTGRGGNPLLDPFRADAIDVSLEWYSDDGYVLTGGFFYKDVESFVATSTNTVNNLPGFEGIDIDFTQPINGGGASIQGLEISTQIPFNFASGFLSGFGILANYTYIDSSIDSGGELDSVDVRTGRTLPFPNLSENSYNLIGYYENEKVSVRLGYNWRDTFLRTIQNGTGVFVDELGTLNASVRYAISENISLDFEATNLTQDPIKEFAGFEESLLSYAVTDRRFFAGIRIKY